MGLVPKGASSQDYQACASVDHVACGHFGIGSNKKDGIHHFTFILPPYFFDYDGGKLELKFFVDMTAYADNEAAGIDNLQITRLCELPQCH